MTPISIQTLNTAVDARQWARTAKDPKAAGRPRESAPSREADQRYNQTASPQVDQPEAEDHRGASVRGTNNRLVGNQMAFFFGTLRDVRRAKQGLAPLRDHSQSSPLFGSQIRFFEETISRAFRRERSSFGD